MHLILVVPWRRACNASYAVRTDMPFGASFSVSSFHGPQPRPTHLITRTVSRARTHTSILVQNAICKCLSLTLFPCV